MSGSRQSKTAHRCEVRKIPTSSLVHFTQFKAGIYKAAQEALIANDPDYVQEWSRDPVGRASRKPAKGLPQKWKGMLEALVSYEFTLEQVKLALKFLGTQCPFQEPICSQGQWVQYHFHAWLDFAYSWKEKHELLVKRASRVLGKHHDGQLQRLLSELPNLWGKLDVTRAKYVHETGAVPGISEDVGWEVCVLLRMDAASFLQDHESLVPFQQRWHAMLVQVTAKQLATLEKFFEHLNKILFLDSRTSAPS